MVRPDAVFLPNIQNCSRGDAHIVFATVAGPTFEVLQFYFILKSAGSVTR